MKIEGHEINRLDNPQTVKYYKRLKKIAEKMKAPKVGEGKSGLTGKIYKHE
jgi:hypothetical protein